MGKMKDLFIDKLNNEDLFNADKALSKEGQDERKNANVSKIVNETLDGTVIQIKNKKKKETLTTYEVDLIYKGMYMKVKVYEKVKDSKPLYKMEAIDSEMPLTEKDNNDILKFIVNN